MIAPWMLYTLIVGGLVGIAALAAERALLLLRRPVRGVWTAALALSLLVPCLAHFFPNRISIPPAVERTILGTAALLSPPKVLAWPYAAVPRPAGFPYGRALLIAWAVASLGLAQLVIYSMAVLHGRRREWRRVVVDGVETLVAPDFGPAVVGWRRLQIVLPAWALDLAEDARGLVLRHEQEHLRQRDPRLLIHASLIVLAMPWNPVLWWQYRRLRRAIELDCDARVVRGGADVARYGEVLLEAGGFCRRGGLPALAAFAERATELEARIKALFPGRPRWRNARVGVAGFGACVMVAAAGLVPDPLSQSGQATRITPANDAVLPHPDLTDLTAWARTQLQGTFTTNRDVLLFRSHEGKFLGSSFLPSAAERLPRDNIESVSVLKGPRSAIPNVLSVVVVTLKPGKQLTEGMDDSFRRFICVMSGSGQLYVSGTRLTGHPQPRGPSCY